MASSSTKKQKRPKGKGKGEPNDYEVPMTTKEGVGAF